MKKFPILALVAILLLCSCNKSLQDNISNPDSGPDTSLKPLATSSPNPIARDSTKQTPLTPRPSPSPTLPDSGWKILQQGFEQRKINLTNENGSLIETLHILRIDPTYYSFDVKYAPIMPRNLQEWQAVTGAMVVVNGGYFSKDEERYYANGLLVIDGHAMGQSYGTFAGMFAVTRQRPELRWLALQPFDPNEPLIAALQSFPMLVKPGGLLGFPSENEDNLMARRTVIGQDHQGRVLFIIAPMGYFTLHKLSKFLTESDLELDIALNLDGGPSSGLLVVPKATENSYEIPAYSPLPIVIAVYTK